jgi:hypothetical protein
LIDLKKTGAIRAWNSSFAKEIVLIFSCDFLFKVVVTLNTTVNAMYMYF